MRLVYTVSVGEFYRALSKITHPLFRAYAARCGADFLSIDKVRSPRPPHFLKLLAVRLLHRYDRIIYFDSDAVVRASCPDLFEIVPEGSLGLVNEQIHGRDWTLEAPDLFRRYGLYWDGRVYNTGVMVFDRSHKNVFRECIHLVKRFGYVNGDGYFDQPYINAAIARLGIKVCELDGRFNWLGVFKGIPKDEAFVIHGAWRDKTVEFLERERKRSGWPAEALS